MGTVTRAWGRSGAVRLVAMGLAVVALAAACSSGGGSGQKGIPLDVATALAARADRIASDLDGGACDQALAEARSLQGDIAGVKADPTVRAEALAGAARLVAAIDCAPTTTTTVAQDQPPPGFEFPIGKGKGHGHDHDHEE
jgi:hypothetical protein